MGPYPSGTECNRADLLLFRKLKKIKKLKKTFFTCYISLSYMHINLKIGHVPIRGTARRQREKRVNRAHTERPAVPRCMSVLRPSYALLDDY